MKERAYAAGDTFLMGRPEDLYCVQTERTRIIGLHFEPAELKEAMAIIQWATIYETTASHLSWKHSRCADRSHSVAKTCHVSATTAKPKSCCYLPVCRTFPQVADSLSESYLRRSIRIWDPLQQRTGALNTTVPPTRSNLGTITG